MQIVLKPMGAVVVLAVIGVLGYFVAAQKSTTSSPKAAMTAAPVLITTEAQGKVGVGTWDTEAEFAEIKVNGKPVKLTPEQGDWTQNPDGSWHQSNPSKDGSLGPEFLALGGDVTAKDYTLTLKARKLQGDEGFLIPFYIRDKANLFWWNMGGWGNKEFQIERTVNGTRSSLVNPRYYAQIETGRWYDIKIACEGGHIRAYLDNKLIHEVTFTPNAR